MQFTITPMTAEYARQIVTWKYDGQYAFYDYEHEAEFIFAADRWGKELFAVLDEEGILCGELTLWFLDAGGARLQQADFHASILCAGKLDGCTLWIGFGMRPDLTGRGLGLSFVNACADFAAAFAREHYHYTGDEIILNVYQFNQRAVKVYERAGFVRFYEGIRIKNGIEYKTQRMKKRIEHQTDA